MANFRRLLVFCLCVFASAAAFAQSADQEVVSVVDSPDPVTPGATLTYTITLKNNGPDPATNGGFNTNIPGGATYQGTIAPAGFTCATFGAAVSCTTPSLAVGTYVFTMTVMVDSSLISFPDTTLNLSVSPSGTTTDPMPGNNSKSASTTVETPQINMGITVADSPDPVGPDANITYTVDVNNAGPDAAQNATFNVFNSGTLLFQSATVPSGWNCTLPAVNGNTTFNCTHAASYASGATSQFIVVVRASKTILGVNDGSVQTAFSVGGTGNETNTSNDGETETTTYSTPDTDMAVSATDSPDPVFPDGLITYTVTVVNNGPDAALNPSMSVFQNNTLLYDSVTVPAGWTCPAHSPGYGGGFTCTAPSFASGATSVFTVVLKAAQSQLGPFDQTLNQLFTVSNEWRDTVNGNNSTTVQTQYVTPDADVSVTASDSPDPVAPDGNITYTVTVTNGGPDTAPNTSFSVPLNNTLLWQSMVVPAGWTCPSLSVGHGAGFTCTNSSFAMGSAVFTIVLKAAKSQIGINDTTLNQNFNVSSTVTDPNNGNNSVTVQTAYVAPDAEVSVSGSDAPDPVAPDGNVTYTMNVTNGGPDPGTNASFNVVLNNTMLFQSITPPAGWTCPALSVGHGASFSCTNPSFAVGTGVFTVVLKAAQSQFGNSAQTINQAFTISSDVADPNGANNAVTIQTQYTGAQADLVVTNSDSPDPVISGQNVTYTQGLTNNGPSTATSVTFTQTLPAGLGFVSMTAPAGWNCTTPAAGASGLITCTIASLASGATANFTLVAKSLTTGSPTVTPAAGSATPDPNSGNNSVPAQTVVNPPTNADLSVNKTTNATSVLPGGAISYTITLTNNGPHNATGVSMTDNLPASLLFQSIAAPAGFSCATPAVGATGTITCTGGSIINGASAVFTLNTTVAANATGSIVNGASAGGAQTDGNSGNSSFSAPGIAIISSSADLAITKTTNATSAVIGSNLTYTINLTNNGPDAATTVAMTDNLPPSLLFQSITQPAGFACTTPAVGASGTITCNAASLASGATASFTLVVRVANTASGTITNTATAASAVTDPNASNSTVTTTGLAVTSSADLSIVKSTSATFAPSGSTLNYTLTVSNAGPSPATSVVVSDLLPAGLQYVGATPSQGSCSGPAPVTCNLGTINSGASVTIALSTTVTATTGTIANSASVSASSSDPSSGNNTGSAAPVPVTAASDIPTMSEWVLIVLGAMLALVAVMRMRAGA